MSQGHGGGGGGHGGGRGTPGHWSPLPPHFRPASPYAGSPPPRMPPPGSPGLPMFAARLPYVPCPRPRWPGPYRGPPPHTPSPTPHHMQPCASPEYFRGVSPYEGYATPPPIPFRHSPAPPPIPASPMHLDHTYVLGVPLEPTQVPGGNVGYRYEPEEHDGPSTADIIANQSQDYVDEKLAEYQATIQQLQGRKSSKVVKHA